VATLLSGKAAILEEVIAHDPIAGFGAEPLGPLFPWGQLVAAKTLDDDAKSASR